MCFQPVKISSPRIEFGDSQSNIFVVVTTRSDLNNSFVSTQESFQTRSQVCQTWECTGLAMVWNFGKHQRDCSPAQMHNNESQCEK